MKNLRKKGMSLLIAGMLMASAVACYGNEGSSMESITSGSVAESVGSGASSEVQDSTLKEPETLEETTVNVAENVVLANQQARLFRQIGRTFIAESDSKTLRCDFTCTGIAFNVVCKGDVKVKFWASAECYFTVYIDGVRMQERLHVKGSDSNSFITVASFDTYEAREIRLVKQSQYAFAYSGISDVQILGSFGKRPKQKERFIEYYGDSALNGSNILKGGTSVKSTDGTLAFGYMSALALNADCNIIGRGGMGLYPKNSSTEGLNEIWNLTSSSKAPGVQEYDFSRTPDVVVVVLGGNDVSSDRYTPQRFKESIQVMIENIRSIYGNDMKIVWCYGYSKSKMDYWDIEKAALDEVNDGTIMYCPITCIAIPKSEGGDGLHTDVAGGAVQGAELAQFLEENIYRE